MKKSMSLYLQASPSIPDDGTNFTQLLKAADIALNKAKDLGKNKVVFYEQHLP